MRFESSLQLTFDQVSRADLADALDLSDGERNALIAGDVDTAMKAIEELCDVFVDSIEPLGRTYPKVNFTIEDPSDEPTLSEAATVVIGVAVDTLPARGAALVEWAQRRADQSASSTDLAGLFASSVLLASLSTA